MVYTVPLSRKLAERLFWKDRRKSQFVLAPFVIQGTANSTGGYLLSLSGKRNGTEALQARWFDVLAKSKKQEFEQVVHMSWERGSIYFEGIKI